MGRISIQKVPIDSDENSDDDEEFEEFTNKYKTELVTSDSNETTDDDEDFEEFMKKLRMKTRPKLIDKRTRLTREIIEELMNLLISFYIIFMGHVAVAKAWGFRHG